MPEGCALIQRDLDRLEKWVDRNLMQFNREMCKILHVWRNNPSTVFKNYTHFIHVLCIISAISTIIIPVS